MKNFKRYLSFAAIIALLFTSCSKEEQSGIVDTEKATLTFGAIVNDLVANRVAERQAEADLPVCSEDSPAYVRIVLKQGDTEVVGTSGNPYRIDLVTGEIYTEDDPALELEPGMYSLDHLSVYNSDDVLIWIAPRSGSGMGEYVDNPLPLSIDLRAGVKKYVDVSVVCFDDRDVNEYGYLFFELDTNIALTYCFFANYCNEDGRHYPARYSVSIWSGTTSAGMLLYSNEENTVGQHDNNEYFATPLCFAVPDHSNMDTPYLYYEVTLLDWEDVYGDVEQTVLSGTITKRMITDNFVGEDDTDYHHLKFGCGDDDIEPPVDSDGDGVPDSIDECPGTAPGVNVNEVGCPVTPPDCVQTDPEADCDNDGTKNKCDEDNPNYATFDCDGDGFLNGVDSCPTVAGVAGGDGGDGCPAIVEGCLPEASAGCDTFSENLVIDSAFELFELNIGDFTAEITGEGLVIGFTPIYPYEFEDIEVTLGSTVVCLAEVVPDQGGTYTFAGITAADLPFNIGVRVNYCDVAE